mgnify:CR=1 FL=1
MITVHEIKPRIVVDAIPQRVLTALNGDPKLPAEDHPTVREKMAARERAALDLAIEYGKSRIQGGQPIIRHQSIGHTLVDIATEIAKRRFFRAT